MGFQTRRILVCICSLIMLIGLTGLVTEHQMIIADNWTSNEIQSGPEDSDSRTLSDYVPHGEIRIDSNAEFESQGWPGNGTQENPYIIEGFQIGSSIGIRIDRTSVFFVIRNCRLVSSGTGIYLARLGKGSIENCEIVGSYYGINLFFCENSTFVKNSIYE